MRKIFILLSSIFLIFSNLSANDVVDRKKLDDVFKQADKILVFNSPYLDGKEIYASSNKKDINELNDALRIIQPETGFRCRCTGDPIIVLYIGNKELLRIGNIDGELIRCSIWESDAFIKDRKKWIKWFDDRGICSDMRKQINEYTNIAK